MSEPTMSDSEILAEAGDAAFNRLNPEGPEKPETPEVPDKPAGEPKTEPTPTPSDKSEDDKLAWVKGLDEKTLNDLKEGKLVPHHRFNDVLERSKAYETLGTPEEVQRKMAELSKKIEDTPKGEQPELTAEEKETQEAILKMFPQLKTYSDMQKEITALKAEQMAFKKAQEFTEKQEHEFRRKEREVLLGKARERVGVFAKELGLDVNDKTILEEFEDDIAGRLHKDKEKADKFYLDGDISVLEEIFKNYKQKFFSGVQRRTEAQILQDKTKQEKLPKPPISGGPATPKEKKVEEMDWSDIGDRAMSRL